MSCCHKKLLSCSYWWSVYLIHCVQSICQCGCRLKLWYLSAASSFLLSSQPTVFSTPGPACFIVRRGWEGWWGEAGKRSWRWRSQWWRRLLVSSSELSGQETSGFGSILRGWQLTHSAVGHRRGRTVKWLHQTETTLPIKTLNTHFSCTERFKRNHIFAVFRKHTNTKLRYRTD